MSHDSFYCHIHVTIHKPLMFKIGHMTNNQKYKDDQMANAKY